mmetsp:Transcript_12247/g.25100  ORF Transcript_12247/g.25100 Transcript_12247/m.25100 type:complete len:217 (+) Transcript_12247:284-934(+)
MLAWRLPRATAVLSWSHFPRVEELTSPVRLLTTRTTLPRSLVALLVPSTSARSLPSTASPSSSTPTTARRPGSHGLMDSSRLPRSTTRNTESPSSPPTCSTLARSPSRRTSQSAGSTWRSLPSSTSSSSSSSESPAERRTELTTPTLTHPGSTHSQRRSCTPTSSSPPYPTLCSLAPHPSVTSTAYTHLEMSTFSLSYCTTRRNTCRRSSVVRLSP